MYSQAAQGNEGGRDSWHKLNTDGAKAAGLYTGAYVLPWTIGWEGTRAPRRQAEAHVSALGTYDLPLMVDLEWPDRTDWVRQPNNKTKGWSLDGRGVSAWCQEYCEAITDLMGRRPVIYTYPHWWAGLTSTDWAADYDLWIANYRDIQDTEPRGYPIVPKPWTEWCLWQWSADKGRRIPGVAGDIDRNMFNGSEAQLREWAGLCRT